MLFTSSELLFTLSCRITQTLLDTHTNKSNHKQTSLHWDRLWVHWCSGTHEGDLVPSRQDSGLYLSSGILLSEWQRRSKAKSLSRPFSSVGQWGQAGLRSTSYLQLCHHQALKMHWLPCAERTGLASAMVTGGVPPGHSSAGPGLQLLLSRVEQQQTAVNFASASSQPLVYVA